MYFNCVTKAGTLFKYMNVIVFLCMLHSQVPFQLFLPLVSFVLYVCDTNVI